MPFPLVAASSDGHGLQPVSTFVPSAKASLAAKHRGQRAFCRPAPDPGEKRGSNHWGTIRRFGTCSTLFLLHVQASQRPALLQPSGLTTHLMTVRETNMAPVQHVHDARRKTLLGHMACRRKLHLPDASEVRLRAPSEPDQTLHESVPPPTLQPA